MRSTLIVLLFLATFGEEVSAIYRFPYELMRPAWESPNSASRLSWESPNSASRPSETRENDAQKSQKEEPLDLANANESASKFPKFIVV